jgi:hypothetical protein
MRPAATCLALPHCAIGHLSRCPARTKGKQTQCHRPTARLPNRSHPPWPLSVPRLPHPRSFAPPPCVHAYKRARLATCPGPSRSSPFSGKAVVAAFPVFGVAAHRRQTHLTTSPPPCTGPQAPLHRGAALGPADPAHPSSERRQCLLSVSSCADHCSSSFSCRSDSLTPSSKYSTPRSSCRPSTSTTTTMPPPRRR